MRRTSSASISAPRGAVAAFAAAPVIVDSLAIDEGYGSDKVTDSSPTNILTAGDGRKGGSSVDHSDGLASFRLRGPRPVRRTASKELPMVHRFSADDDHLIADSGRRGRLADLRYHARSVVARAHGAGRG